MRADRSGWIAGILSRPLGIRAMEMGAGRAAREDVLDLGAGIEVHARVGQRVEKGDVLLTLHHNGRPGNPLPPHWIRIQDTPCAPSPWLLETVD